MLWARIWLGIIFGIPWITLLVIIEINFWPAIFIAMGIFALIFITIAALENV